MINDHGSKKIYRPKMVVWSGAVFILRWSCLSDNQNLWGLSNVSHKGNWNKGSIYEMVVSYVGFGLSDLVGQLWEVDTWTIELDHG